MCFTAASSRHNGADCSILDGNDGGGDEEDGGSVLGRWWPVEFRVGNQIWLDLSYACLANQICPSGLLLFFSFFVGIMITLGICFFPLLSFFLLQKHKWLLLAF